MTAVPLLAPFRQGWWGYSMARAPTWRLRQTGGGVRGSGASPSLTLLPPQHIARIARNLVAPRHDRDARGPFDLVVEGASGFLERHCCIVRSRSMPRRRGGSCWSDGGSEFVECGGQRPTWGRSHLRARSGRDVHRARVGGLAATVNATDPLVEPGVVGPSLPGIQHPSVANDARVLRYTRPLKGALSSTVHRELRKPRPRLVTAEARDAGWVLPASRRPPSPAPTQQAWSQLDPMQPSQPSASLRVPARVASSSPRSGLMRR